MTPATYIDQLRLEGYKVVALQMSVDCVHDFSRDIDPNTWVIFMGYPCYITDNESGHYFSICAMSGIYPVTLFTSTKNDYITGKHRILGR